MIKSMTAFANSEQNFSGEDDNKITLSWEIRSVNHRYLDASVYLSEGFSHLDTQLKDLLRKKLGRGKIDAKLVCQTAQDQKQGDLQIDNEIVKGLFGAQSAIGSIAKESSGEFTSLSTMQILQYPGVLKDSEVDYSHYDKKVISTFKEALNTLVESREEEGGRLKTMLLTRGESINTIVAQVKKRRPLVIQALRNKVLKKINDLDLEADNNRLEQELVIQAQRLDVDEELDRLDSHIEELVAVLDRNEPVGRRLDFLMQELNREANTLGSKANDAETTKASVELKVLIEQMREQVMNIE